MVDRSLNYGRHLIDSFFSSMTNVKDIVDLGAGGGTDLGIAKLRIPTARLHAIECWPPYIDDMTKKGFKVHPLNIEKDALPFADGSMDVVMSNQVLEHTKEIFWIFHESTRVLREGGYLVIGVPNLASLHNRLLLALGRQPSQIKSASAHVRGFTKPDILNFVDSCYPGGYRLVSFGGSNFYPFPAFVAKPLAAMLPSMAWGIFFLLQKTAPYTDEFARFPRANQLETNFFVGPAHEEALISS